MALRWMICDRCNEEFRGAEMQSASGNTYCIGFFRFYREDGSPTIWNKYARGIEDLICYSCMWQDEEYLNQYPFMRQRGIRDQILKGIDK